LTAITVVATGEPKTDQLVLSHRETDPQKARRKRSVLVNIHADEVCNGRQKGEDPVKKEYVDIPNQKMFNRHPTLGEYFSKQSPVRPDVVPSNYNQLLSE